MNRPDLQHVEVIADEVHNKEPGLHERAAVLAEKFQLFGRGAFVLVDTGRTVGYGFSHPWSDDSVPILDRFIGKLPWHPKVMYIHDVAILKPYRGQGLVGQYLYLIRQQALKLGISLLALTAVRGSHVVWNKYGFVEQSIDPAYLERYGDCRYMTCLCKDVRYPQ